MQLNNIDLILKEKQAELELLKSEMKDALGVQGDVDFEYAALIYPLIGEIQREIRYFNYLEGIGNPVAVNSFVSYLQRLLAEEWSSLHIAIDIRSYPEYTGSIVEIRKMKTRHRVECIFTLTAELSNFIYPEVGSELRRLGWKDYKRNNAFIYKTRLKNTEDLASFHVWLSGTLLGPLKSIWSHADKQYYLLNKMEQSP
jgi:hypothetical protein